MWNLLDMHNGIFHAYLNVLKTSQNTVCMLSDTLNGANCLGFDSKLQFTAFKNPSLWFNHLS